MTRNAFGKATFVAVAALLSSAAVSGCSSSNPGGPAASGSTDTANKGIIALAIDVGGGLTVNTVD